MIALAVDLIDNERTTIDEAASTYCKYIELDNTSYCKEILL